MQTSYRLKKREVQISIFYLTVQEFGWSAGSFCGRLCPAQASSTPDGWGGQQHTTELRRSVRLLQEVHGAVFTAEHWSTNAATHQNISEISAWIRQQSSCRQLAQVCSNISVESSFWSLLFWPFEILLVGLTSWSLLFWPFEILYASISSFNYNKLFLSKICINLDIFIVLKIYVSFETWAIYGR